MPQESGEAGFYYLCLRNLVEWPFDRHRVLGRERRAIPVETRDGGH